MLKSSIHTGDNPVGLLASTFSFNRLFSRYLRYYFLVLDLDYWCHQFFAHSSINWKALLAGPALALVCECNIS